MSAFAVESDDEEERKYSSNDALKETNCRSAALLHSSKCCECRDSYNEEFKRMVNKYIEEEKEEFLSMQYEAPFSGIVSADLYNRTLEIEHYTYEDEEKVFVGRYTAWRQIIKTKYCQNMSNTKSVDDNTEALQEYFFNQVQKRMNPDLFQLFHYGDKTPFMDVLRRTSSEVSLTSVTSFISLDGPEDSSKCEASDQVAKDWRPFSQIVNNKVGPSTPTNERNLLFERRHVLDDLDDQYDPNTGNWQPSFQPSF